MRSVRVFLAKSNVMEAEAFAGVMFFDVFRAIELLLSKQEVDTGYDSQDLSGKGSYRRHVLPEFRPFVRDNDHVSWRDPVISLATGVDIRAGFGIHDANGRSVSRGAKAT